MWCHRRCTGLQMPKLLGEALPPPPVRQFDQYRVGTSIEACRQGLSILRDVHDADGFSILLRRHGSAGGSVTIIFAGACRASRTDYGERRKIINDTFVILMILLGTRGVFMCRDFRRSAGLNSVLLPSSWYGYTSTSRPRST